MKRCNCKSHCNCAHYKDVPRDLYEYWLEAGNIGTPSDFLDWFKGPTGNSAYEDAVESGEFEGTLQEWLNSLKGGLFQADFEDLEVTDDDVIKFKDRYDSDGLGYKILRRNTVLEGKYTTKEVEVLEVPEENGTVRVTIGGKVVNVSLVGGVKRIVDFRVTSTPSSDGNIVFKVPIEGEIVLTGVTTALNTVEKVVDYIVDNMVSELYTITKEGTDKVRLTDTIKRPSQGYTSTSTAGVSFTITGVNNNGSYPDTVESILTKISNASHLKDYYRVIKNSKLYVRNRDIDNSDFDFTIVPNTTNIEVSISSSSENITEFLLESEDLEPNTIHEIRYNFNLNGKVLNIPENVTLKFKGGRITNGDIVGDFTKISSDKNQIFSNDIEFKTGSFLLDEIYPEWFGVKTFYINSNNLNTESLSSPLYNIPAQVDDLPDASIGINKALELSTRSTGVVRLARGFHKIENTVKMPMKSHLKFEVDSVFAVYMNGEGVRLMEHDEDTMEIRELSTASEPIFKVKQNQFFHTDTMAHAIEVNPQQTEISGRGTITLAKSRYTIGVLIRGHGFHFLDMSYGSPKIDIRVVGDHTVRTRGIDYDDIVGTGDPSEDIGVAGDKYWDKEGLTSWSKNNNGTWSILYQRGFADPKFNVHLRVDVGQGFSSGRLIDPEINIWGMFGWRGIEIWTHDGGWFNEGRWGGTISNIHGQCVAIYTAYDVVNHDMSMMTYQVDNNTQRDGGIFYAIKGGGIKVGNAWDMSWIQVAYRRAFYLGRGTNRITVKTYDRQRYVIDLGSNNFYDKPIGRDMLDFSNFETLQFYNLLKYRSIRQMTSNRQRGVYYEIPEFLGSDLGNIWYRIQTEIVPANEGTEDLVPKIWFDGTNTYSKVIDTDNGKYGFVLKIPTLHHARGAEFKGAVIIEYSMGNYVNDDKLVTDRKDIRLLHNIGGESPNGAGWNLNSAVRYPDDPATVGRYSEISFPTEPRTFTQGGWIKNTYQLIIPFRLRGSQLHNNNSVLAVLAVNDVKPLRLNIHNLSIVVEGKAAVSFDHLFNPNSENSLPDSAPKGVIHTLNNTGETFINKGTTEEPEWKNVPTEDAGAWEIVSSSGMSSPNAEYSKIGKQVSLSGLLSFSSAYDIDSTVQIVLPFSPKYGGVYTIGDLTFTLSNNSTSATVKSSSRGNNKPFNLHFKTA